MIMRKPQILDAHYSLDFFQNLWMQRPLVDFFLFSDTNYSSSNFYNIEGYTTLDVFDEAAEKTFLFFYPPIEWIHYTAPLYEYKGSVATSQNVNDIVYVEKQLPEVPISEYDTYVGKLEHAIEMACRSEETYTFAEMKKGTTNAYLRYRAANPFVMPTSVSSSRLTQYNIALYGIGEGFIEFFFNDEQTYITDGVLTTRNLNIGTVTIT